MCWGIGQLTFIADLDSFVYRKQTLVRLTRDTPTKDSFIPQTKYILVPEVFVYGMCEGFLYGMCE